MSGTLIVGASQAGVELAVALRRGGDTAPITLVGAEEHPPYQRPPLSKTFLGGSASLASLALRTRDFYAQQRIDVRSGTRVLAVRDGTAATDRGGDLRFDRLALTVGARARRLDVPGIDLAGVIHLRTIDDSVALRAELAGAGSVVVVGGGFIGLEVAAVARIAGARVHVVEATERLMGRTVAEPVAEMYRQAHVRRGVRMSFGSGVVALHGVGGRIAAVELADGRRLRADLVVVGVGIAPRTELATGMGLACAGGILVDAAARTSDPAVVAAGDCTVAPHPVTGMGLVRLESVPNAQAQARRAAATLLGIAPPAPAVPWFWSDQYDLKLQIAGLADGHDRVVVRTGPQPESMSVLYYRAGVLLAVHAVNRASDYFAVLRALGAGATIPAERAGDRTADLRDHVVPRPRDSLLTDGAAPA